MKNKSLLFIITLFLMLQSSFASAGYLNFYDTANEWDGIQTRYHNTDVVGTPQLTGGRFVFDDHTLKGIELDYTSTSKNIMPADWFFDFDQDNKWDYILHNVSTWNGWRTSRRSNYDLYKVDMPIDDWDNYIEAFVPYGHGRTGHVVQADKWYLNKYGTLLDRYISFSQWDYNTKRVTEDSPATAIWSGFEIELDQYAGQHMTYAFAMTCANDVLFSEIPIPSPEPGTFILFGAGAIGLFFYQRRRQSSKII